MNEKLLKEWWELMSGEETIPDALLSICKKFFVRKCRVVPCSFTVDDFVLCTMVYDVQRTEPDTKPEDPEAPQKKGRK